MIRRPFEPPNFRCRVKDWHGDESDLLMRGDSEASVRQRLEQKSYQVVSVEPYDFRQWLERAEAETRKVIECSGGPDYQYRSDIWGDLKQYLFELFEGKCAYCEGKVLHIASGDVEHYRPKKKVTECPSHPGYYWLAYEARNLLPCCEKCNRHRAKMNHFPVRGDLWAHRHDEMDCEKPLLLCPYDHDPREHLRFLPSTQTPGAPDLVLSIVQGATEEGRKSVEIYKLNRPDLASERGLAQKKIRQELMASMLSPSSTRRAVWDRLFSGRDEYSSAALAEAEALLAELKEEYEQEKTEHVQVPSGKRERSGVAGRAG